MRRHEVGNPAYVVPDRADSSGFKILLQVQTMSLISNRYSGSVCPKLEQEGCDNDVCDDQRHDMISGFN